MKPAEMARASREQIASASAAAEELAADQRQARNAEDATERDAQLTLLAAAERFGLGYRSLRKAADTGLVRFRDRRRHGAGHSYLFNVDELAEDLGRLPACTAAGCDNAALLDPAFCPTHARPRAAHAAERALLDDPNRTWLTRLEAAALAGVAPETLRSAERRHEIASVLAGRHRRYERADVETWAARWRSAPSSGYEKRRGRPHNRPGAEELRRRREQVRRLHREGHTVGRIAQLTGWSIPTVRRELDALGLERPNRGKRPRRLPPEARERRQREAARLYLEERLSLAEIARRLHSSPTQIGRDLRAAGVELRRGGPPAKYAPPVARECLHCGAEFTPAFPALGHQKFCNRECALAERNAARQQELDRRGLLGTREAADRLGVGEHRVVDYIKRRELAAERIVFAYASRPGYGISPAELDRFEREWARSDGALGSQRALWLDAEYVLRRWRGNGWLERLAAEKGLTTTEAEAVIRARVSQRSTSLARRRCGRKKASAPPIAHLRWLDRFDRISDELWHEHRERIALGLPTEPPTDWQIAGAVAEGDWREHPGDWPRDRYPASKNDSDSLSPKMASTAADRVRTAIKRLQNARTEKTAA